MCQHVQMPGLCNTVNTFSPRHMLISDEIKSTARFKIWYSNIFLSGGATLAWYLLPQITVAAISITPTVIWGLILPCCTVDKREETDKILTIVLSYYANSTSWQHWNYILVARLFQLYIIAGMPQGSGNTNLGNLHWIYKWPNMNTHYLLHSLHLR